MNELTHKVRQFFLSSSQMRLLGVLRHNIVNTLDRQKREKAQKPTYVMVVGLDEVSVKRKSIQSAFLLFCFSDENEYDYW